MKVERKAAAMAVLMAEKTVNTKVEYLV